MRYLAACLLLALCACGDDAPAEPTNLDSGVDGGADAALQPRPDSGRDAATDARVDGGTPDAAVDSGLDAQAAQATACQQERAFLAAHKACVRDEDCAIAGSCSGGFGFEAVQASVTAQAQAYSDRTSCGKVYDGPTYNAVCEQATCVKRENGQACGRVPTDASVPDVCSEGRELYRSSCSTPFICRQRCTGTADTQCGAGAGCKLESVSVASERYDNRCEPKQELWLCSALP